MKNLNRNNVIILSGIHALGLYGFATVSNYATGTIITAICLYGLTGFSITGGLHRFWSHRCYEAHRLLQYFFLALSSAAMVGSVKWWVRDHRMHHMFSDTELDPHNANRGFWYSHVGWLLLEKSAAVRKASKTIRMRDIEKDPLLNFQHRHYYLVAGFFGLGVPTVFCGLLFNDWLGGFMFAGYARIVWTLNCTFLVNSWAHHFGRKPFDKTHKTTESHLVSFLAFGEGYHNYHHAYQNDWRGSHSILNINPTAWTILLLSKIGLAKNLIQRNHTEKSTTDMPSNLMAQNRTYN